MSNINDYIIDLLYKEEGVLYYLAHYLYPDCINRDIYQILKTAANWYGGFARFLLRLRNIVIHNDTLFTDDIGQLVSYLYNYRDILLEYNVDDIIIQLKNYNVLPRLNKNHSRSRSRSRSKSRSRSRSRSRSKETSYHSAAERLRSTSRNRNRSRSRSRSRRRNQSRYYSQKQDYSQTIQ